MTAQLKLFQAARDNDKNLAVLALKEGADINAKNSQEETALIIAAKHNANDVCSYLLEQEVQKVNVDAKDLDLRTALHHATINNNFHQVKKLLEHQAQHDVQDRDGRTPLVIAIKEYHLAIAAILSNISAPNYHAEHLTLCRNIISLTDGEDVISNFSHQVSKLMPKLDIKTQSAVVKINAMLLQPNELLQFDALSRSRKLTFSRSSAAGKEENDTLSGKKIFNRLKEITRDNSPKKTEPNAITISDLDEESRKQFAMCDLSITDSFFSNIQKIIKELELLLVEVNIYEKSAFNKLGNLINSVKQFYQKYIEDVCKNKNDKRIILCEHRTQIRGPFGFYYLSNINAAGLTRLFSDAKSVKENTVGNHDLLSLIDTFIKIDPESPGIQDAVDKLDNIITGEIAGTMLYAAISKGKKEIDISASKTVHGIDFFAVLAKYPEWLNCIDSYNYSAKVNIDFITCSADHKADAFIAVITKDKDDKVISIRLVPIDNDLAFRDPISYVRTSKEHFLEAYSVLWLAPQMDLPYDRVFLDNFVNKSPSLSVLDWLKELLDQEQMYLNYNLIPNIKNELGFLADSNKSLKPAGVVGKNIPVKFLPGTVQLVFERIKKIREALIKNPAITHQQVFEILYPAVAKFYQRIRTQFNNYAANMNEAFEYVYSKKLCPSFEKLFPNDAEILKQIEPFNRSHPEICEGEFWTESLEQACKNFFEKIDYAELENIDQQKVLERMSEFKFLKKVVIKNCRSLTDDLLMRSVSELNLDELRLINCQGIEGNGISQILIRNPNIKIYLQDVTHISTLNIYYLLRDCPNLMIIMSSGEYDVKRQSAELLEVALRQEKNINLSAALLYYRAHLIDDAKGQSPLHYACQKGYVALVEKLLQLGVNIDSLSNKGQSALHLTFEMLSNAPHEKLKAQYRQIIALLIEKGALDCKAPAKEQANEPDLRKTNEPVEKSILNIALTQIKQPIRKDQYRLLSAIFKFACCYNFITPDLIKLLIPTDTSALDLNPPTKAPLKRLNLNLNIIAAITLHLTGLKTIVISGCLGLNKEILDVLLKHPTLESIDLDFDQAIDCKLLTYDNIHLATQLRDGNIRINIVSLILRKNKLTDNVRKNLALFIESTKHLKFLDLCRCGLDAKTIEPIAVSLKKNSSVTDLLLNGNLLGNGEQADNKKDSKAKNEKEEKSKRSEGIILLVENLKGHNTLRKLDLEETNIDAIDAESIGDLLANVDCRIDTISLLNNPLKDKGVVEIANRILFSMSLKRKPPELQFKSMLRSVIFNQVEMGPEGAKLLALLFRKIAIEFFDVGYNRKIGNAGAYEFLQVILKNSNITRCQVDQIMEVDDAEITAQFKAALFRNQQINRDIRQLERYETTQEHGYHRHLQSNLPPEYTELKELRIQNAHLRSQMQNQVPNTNQPKNVVSTLLLNSSIVKDSNKIKSKLVKTFNELKEVGYVIQVSFQNNTVLFRVIKEPENKLPLVVKTFWHNIVKSLGTLGPQEQYEETNDHLKISRITEGKLEGLKLLAKELAIQENNQFLGTQRQTSYIVKSP